MATRGRKPFKQIVKNPKTVMIKFVADKSIQDKLEKIAMSEHRSVTQQANLFLTQCVKNYQINGE